MNSMYPLTPEEFRVKYAGYKCVEAVDSVGKFGELKHVHDLKVFNNKHEIVYREWRIC